MPRTTCRALVTAAALVLSLLSVAPARATTTAVVGKPGTMVKVYRGDVQRVPGGATAHASHLTVVPGAAATPRSTWIVGYDAGFNANPQAKAAFQAAVDIWAGIITSAVPIRVAADFSDLGDGVLGFAGPHEILPPNGAGDRTSWYPVALLNALKGSDQLLPSTSQNESGVDIDASFSSTEPGIYYGTDSNPPSGYIDFESIVLHELGHGLGFGGSAEYDSGYGHYETPRFVFDSFNSNSAGTRLITLPNDSRTLGTALTNGDVYWNGAQATAANGGVAPKLYAPGATAPYPAGCSGSTCQDAGFSSGSSIAHLDEATYPRGTVNSLMTPYVDDQEVVHTPGPITVGIMRDMGWHALLAAPAAPTGVTGESGKSAVDLTWVAPAPNGSPITSYLINVSDGATVSQIVSQGPATAKTITGLLDGTSYTFTVQAVNAIGTGPQSAPSAAVQPGPDLVAPTVSITSVQRTGNGPATGTITFTGSDPGHAKQPPTYTCSLDSGAPVTCASPFSYSGLTDGSSHTFTVTARDAAGNVSPASATWTVDAVAPTIVVPTLPTYTIAGTIKVGATATDKRSGVATYDFRYRRAAYNGAFGVAGYPGTWQRTAARSVSFVPAQGNTYCFGVRARDQAGNVSAWSAERCTSTGLDDRSLVASSGWTRAVNANYFLHTSTETRKTGATLTRTSVQTRRFAVVAARCSSCGTIGVYFNGKLIKNLVLKQSSTQFRVINQVISFPSLSSGTIVLKALTPGTFHLDGLVLSKV